MTHANHDGEFVDIAIIGAGLGGLLAAAKLREAGFGSVVVFERAGDLGGVWRENQYPNVACDTPIDLYAISYFPGSKWSANFAPGAEILDYFHEFSDAFGVTPLIAFNTEIARVEWGEASARWLIEARDGRRWTCRYIVWAGGLLSRPALPQLPGLDAFSGEMLHTARWRRDVRLDGKRVALVGAGASAIQVAPYAAEHAAQVYSFVRTPSFVLPRPDLFFDQEDRDADDFAQKQAHRRLEWFNLFEKIAEARFPMNPAAIAQAEANWRAHFDTTVRDPRLREILTPAYRFGCKRPLFSNEYYPAMCRDNVAVVGRGVARVEPRAIVDTEGRAYEVDMIVWATGFDAQNALGGLEIVGRDGRTLADAWRDIPQAFFGTFVKSFPNLFLINGPNVGGASATDFMENQIELIARAMRVASDQSAETIEVRASAQDAFNADIQRRARASVLMDCNSWYRAGGDGDVFTHWTGSIASFRTAIAAQALDGLQFSKARSHAK